MRRFLFFGTAVASAAANCDTMFDCIFGYFGKRAARAAVFDARLRDAYADDEFRAALIRDGHTMLFVRDGDALREVMLIAAHVGWKAARAAL